MNKEIVINNHVWLIEEQPEEYLLEEYHKRVKNAYSCLGLTFYKDHKIWIADDLCPDAKMKALKHELTHAYIWEYGFYNVDFNNEELICDFVSGIYDFIKEVVEDIKL